MLEPKVTKKKVPKYFNSVPKSHTEYSANGGFPRYYYDALPALLLLTARDLEICRQGLLQF